MQKGQEQGIQSYIDTVLPVLPKNMVINAVLGSSWSIFTTHGAVKAELHQPSHCRTPESKQG